MRSDMAPVSQAIDFKRSGYTQVIILSYGMPEYKFNQTKKRLEEQGKVVHIVNISYPIYWPENLSIDERTKVIIVGHSNAGREYILSNDNNQSMHFKTLAALISQHTITEEKTPNLILSLHSCYGGSDASDGSNHESSFAAKLIRELKQTHTKNARISARLGSFCENFRSVGTRGGHNLTKAKDSKVILLLDDKNQLLPSYPYGYSGNHHTEARKTRVEISDKGKKRSILHVAAIKGDITDSTPDLDQNINAQDANGSTPLYLAVLYGNTSSVEFLLDKGADANIADSNGITPLYLAVYNGNLDIIAQLINATTGINVQKYSGNTSLHCAVICGRADVAELLINADADVNVKDSDGFTPLHYAAICGYTDVAELLINAGADINAKDFNGNIPLHLAARDGHMAVVIQLMKHGADVKAKNSNGNTPLHLAAQNGHMNVVEQLINEGVDVSAKNSNGYTPLHAAAQNGHMNVVAQLITAGADVNEKTRYGNTPRDLAALKGYEDVASLIKAKQVSSPLHSPLFSARNSVSFFEGEKENHKPLPAFSPGHHQRL